MLALHFAIYGALRMPLDQPGFLSNWQDALTLGSYLAFTVFIAWQIFTRT